MIRTPNITPLQVRELIDYDHESGEVRWRTRGQSWFKTKQAHSRFNRLFAGRLAGSIQAGPHKSYTQIRLMGVNYPMHQVVWAHFTGAWPALCIDHINGDGTDNRMANLREVSRRENQQNLKKRKDNKSGVTGVYWDSRDRRWRSRIKVDGRHRSLGMFDNFFDAVCARKSAEIQHGFHPNHGSDRKS